MIRYSSRLLTRTPYWIIQYNRRIYSSVPERPDKTENPDKPPIAEYAQQPSENPERVIENKTQGWADVHSIQKYYDRIREDLKTKLSVASQFRNGLLMTATFIVVAGSILFVFRETFRTKIVNETTQITKR